MEQEKNSLWSSLCSRGRQVLSVATLDPAVHFSDTEILNAFQFSVLPVLPACFVCSYLWPFLSLSSFLFGRKYFCGNIVGWCAALLVGTWCNEKILIILEAPPLLTMKGKVGSPPQPSWAQGGHWWELDSKRGDCLGQGNIRKKKKKKK